MDISDAESTSAQLARVTAERDLLAARIQGAHEALAIDEFDSDSCDTLESTVQYAVHHYRLVCDSEATAADEIGRLRGELAAAEVERDDARALVASVARSNWVVARDLGYECLRAASSPSGPARPTNGCPPPASPSTCTAPTRNRKSWSRTTRGTATKATATRTRTPAPTRA